MREETIFDYIIVGQGVAGSVLALTLASSGLKVLIINEEKPNTSSKIAAGLLNPVTGFRKKKAWLADIIFPVLHQFYLKQEQVLNEQFYHPKDIFIPFDSIQSQNDWISKSGDNEWSSFIETSELPDSYHNRIIQPFGGMSIKQSGWVDIPKLLQATKKYFTQKEAYLSQKIEYTQIQFGENIIVNGITAKMIIFCEGTNTMLNPFFDWIPFVPNKGEILDIKLENFPTQFILNKGVFLLPIHQDIFRCGSTYYNEFDSPDGVTAVGKKELLTKLKGLILENNIEIIGHKANVRPAVLGRRPVLGFHPQYPQLGIFNGLGSKGVSLAPYFAKVLAHNLLNATPLPIDVNCVRFWKE